MVTLHRALRPASRSVTLGDAARAAVGNRSPILRVIGAPGSGKTTLAIEFVSARVAAGELRADQCLLLAPTRLAAARLRDAVTARVGGTTSEAMARTHQAFGFAILRAEAALRGDPAPTLLSGPEQDVVLRDLLAGHRAAPHRAPPWPAQVQAALETRGFRAELRDLLMRAAEHGVDAPTLRQLGIDHDKPEWVAAAVVLDEYDQVTALSRPGAYDPAYILTAAADVLEDDPEALARVREQVRLVVVDDAQELTWAGARLLRVLAHPGMQVVLVADPDSAVQTFRGAQPRLLWSGSWPELAHSPIVTLDTAYRVPLPVGAAAARIAARIGAVGGGSQRAVLDAVEHGRVGDLQVALLRAVTQEGAYLASVLRRAHLQGGMPWHDMAVVVRGGARAATIKRSLAAAGVPVGSAPGALPIRDEVAVRPLLLLLELALRGAREPDSVPTPDETVELLTSTIAGVDAVALRRLRRALRRVELDDGGGRTSDELLAAALVDPVAAAASGPLGAPLRQLARALAAGVAACRQDDQGRWAPGVTAEAALWAIWSALGIADGWRDEALRGGSRGARADRDLDAVLGLFAAAAKYADRLPGRGPDGFLDHIRSEDVPGDTLVPRAPSDDVVEVVTPAGAAGREWELVCVAGVQEGVWPDLRLRGSLLGSAELVDLLTSTAGSTVDAHTAVRYDETRLFYVALTRATSRVVVTAVRSDDEQPSVYLDLVDPVGVEDGLRAFTEPDRVLSMAAIVGSLRRSAASDDPADRQRAARLLVDLADHGVAAAEPAAWWTSVPAPDDRPRHDADTPVRVTPSTLERFQKCPLQWLITTTGGTGAGQAAATIGTLVHEVVAQHGDEDLATLTAAVDRRWPQLGLAHGWVSERKRHEAHDMVRRIVEYAAAHRHTWEFIGAEQPFEVEVGRAVVRGSVDRLERHTGTGEVRVLDYKTGATKVTKPELLAVHPQLGAYQVAVTHGAFPQAGSASAGAALLYIGRTATKAPDVRLQPPLAKADDPGWAAALIESSAEGMAGVTFAAQPSDACDRCAVRGSCPAQPEGQAV